MADTLGQRRTLGQRIRRGEGQREHRNRQDPPGPKSFHASSLRRI
jgi:hypothetical protein